MIRAVLAWLLTAALPVAALAAPVTDCPLRDLPFTIDSPLIDVLLSAPAKAAADRAMGGKLEALPPFFSSTNPPTFGAIVSLREVTTLAGGDPAVLPALDKMLRTLPVTESDRVARCARYDDDRPNFTLRAGRRHLLLFEKIAGYKDVPGFNAAHAAFVAMAIRKGWDLVVTDKAGAFTPAILKQFDAVIWNNISGDVLTLSERQAFRDYIEHGGGYVGVHGSAGDPIRFWNWYTDDLVGARFIGHAMQPQFQAARILVDDKASPVAADLPAEWTMTDEWYSFAASPRASGADIVARLDESSYKPIGMMGQKLAMSDHPIAWTRKVGRGRMFYSAIGHRPESYSEPHHVTMLENALAWVIGPTKADAASR
jgi:type 1 glutamine amidotransferase